MTDELSVAVAGKRVGLLLHEDYHYSFRYDSPGQLDARNDLVSLTMPVRARSFETQVLPPPFQSVLPEGELLIRLRARFGKALNLEHDVNLLALVGHNTVGRVTFHSPQPEDGRDTPTNSGELPTYDLQAVLRHPDAEALLDELIDTYGIRSGIGGVHPKVLLDERGMQLTITCNNVIVKAAGPRYPHLPVNEHFCLAASRAAGIPTVASHLSDTGDLLAIERFDRGADGEPIAFEEMCALRHLSRTGKYDGGYEDIVDVMRQIPCHDTMRALETFYCMVVLASATRNGDAHLKNFGVLYGSTDRVDFAPAYDLVTTTVYLSKDTPALALAGRKVWPDRSALEAFGLHVCGLRTAAVRRALEQVVSAVAETAAELQRFGRAEPRCRALCEAMHREWTKGLAVLEG